MRCPICNHAVPSSDSTTLPFCSKRCREIDLGRWLGESYSLQIVPDPEADELPQDDWAQDGKSIHPSDQNS
ncbi:MAG: DNA gyrase inhibitor YacG [Pirellulales bacterium]